MIYHYCKLETLIAILKNKTLWASNYKYLNDHKEIEAAIETIEKNIDFISDGIKGYKNSDAVINCISNSIGYYNNYFITSFSKESDMLSQWRAYADNGRGVSIGFNEVELDKLKYPILDVIYGKGNFIKIIIEHSITYLKKEKLNNSDLDQFAIELSQIIGRYKSEAFLEEKEKRLIIISKENLGNIKFRAGGNFIVPYLEISFNKNFNKLIEEIWIGPAQKDQDTKNSVQFLKDYLEYKNAFIISSTATFRD